MKRFLQHKQGQGALITRLRRPKTLIGAMRVPNYRIARRLERALQHVDRGRKLDWARNHPLFRGQ